MDLTRMDLTQCSIELEIQDLVLVGIPVHQCDALQQAIVGELHALLTQHGIPSTLTQATQVPQTDGGQITLARDTPDLSRAIAQAIYRGLGG
jgi:hypothetical protein